MRFIYGQGWVHGYEDETDGTAAGGDGTDSSDAGEGDGGAADGAGEGDDAGDGSDSSDAGDGAGVDGGDGAAGAAAGKAKGSMLDAINKKLGYDKGAAGDAAADGAKQPAAGKDTATAWANGKPKKDAAGNELNDQGQITKAAAAPAQPAKPKTSAELSLNPAELAALQPKTRQRFHDLSTSLKAAETRINDLSTQNTSITKARDAILDLMDETRTSQEALGALLEFNMLASSDDPKDLRSALDMMNDQRADLMRRLGIVDPGEENPFKDYPDLAKEVEDERISRERALEIVGRRRADADAQARRNAQLNAERQRNDRQSQTRQDGTQAMADIDAWEKGLSTSDLDYAAKRGILMAARGDQPSAVDEVLSKYPPSQWLPTLKLLYAGINVQRAAAPGDKRQQPIRPRGARPGAKKASSMGEAIDSALGYKQ